MGEVWRAIDTRLGREVAIKTLPEAFAKDKDWLTRFAREAKLLASLNHPNIAAIHGFDEDQGVHFLVLELVEGDTLADRLRHGPIGVEESLKLARQVSEALEAAHEKGVIHRDLKPANIKVRPDGTVKLLDFGLAKVLEHRDLSELPTLAIETQAGVVLGTAAYMSPEQARGLPLDKRTDIWAFGCVLYEMMTGRRVFQGDGVTDVLAGILERAPDFTALPPGTPAAIRRLLRRCLEKDRKRRVPDIAMARLEIDEALTPEVGSVPESARDLPKRWRERVAWAAAGFAIVLASVLAVLILARSPIELVLTRTEISTPPTSDPSSMALSPNGRQLAFVASDDGRSRLWVRPLDQVVSRPLAGTEGASAPFWKPDSSAIGFFAEGKLKRIDATGGAAQVLADAPSGRGGAWSPNDIIVFAPQTNDRLMQVGVSGGAATPATEFATAHGSHRWPQFLPDGRRFLFFMGQGVPAWTGMYIGSLDGGDPIRVLGGETAAVYAPPGYLLQVSQGVLVAYAFDAASGVVHGEPMPLAHSIGTGEGIFRGLFSVSDTGVLVHRPGTGSRRQLVLVDRSGTTISVVGSPDDQVPAGPELAPDDRRVAVMRGAAQRADIWLIDVLRGEPIRFTFQGGALPIWSFKGDRLVFHQGRDLFETSSIGPGDGQLLLAGQGGVAQDWSRDGLLLYATNTPATNSDLWVLPLTGEGKRSPVVQTSFDEGQGQFSPDGRWLAYVSDETNRQEVYIQPFPGPGERTIVSRGGGIYPRWGRETRELFYLAPDGRLMAVPLELRPNTDALVPAGPPVPLFPTHLATGAYILSFGYNAKAQYDVTRDGRFLLNVAVDDTDPPPITVVLNWTVALQQVK